jgi:hypothetical protein
MIRLIRRETPWRDALEGRFASTLKEHPGVRLSASAGTIETIGKTASIDLGQVFRPDVNRLFQRKT